MNILVYGEKIGIIYAKNGMSYHFLSGELSSMAFVWIGLYMRQNICIYIYMTIYIIYQSSYALNTDPLLLYTNFLMFFCPLSLYSVDELWEGIWNQTHLVIWISLERDYTTLPDLMIRHAQIIILSNLCCLEQHTEQSASVTEMWRYATFVTFAVNTW